MLKAIIVDDEQKSIISLKWELSNFSDEILVKQVFTSPIEAIEYLKTHPVDCVFLDIDMPEMDGFQFLKYFPQRRFCVIFVTAYDRYAINAIKEHAFDYLLKPVDTDDLTETLSKIKTYIAKQKQQGDSVTQFNTNRDIKITISIGGQIRLFDPDEILYCKSDGNYCHLYLTDGNHHLITKKLKDIEHCLDGNTFLRVHHSYNVNMTKVKSFDRSKSMLLLETGVEISVSRSNKKLVIEKLLHD